jgi:D-alanyl-D-alanine carboxypeptidase
MADLSRALDHLDAFVARRMAADGTPGASLAITDRDGTIAVRSYGLADLAARAPVTAETLFEIGSIGKAFTALALLGEVEAGRLDLHRPLRDYLPWFELPSRYAPVTPHHLLTHTAGIPAGPDFTPEAAYQVWALRELEASAAPGSLFHYSNLGYKALGMLLEQLAGRPYPEAVRERILVPLGMDASAAAITNAIRPRMATGHTTLDDERPWHPSRPLVPAPWVETATGDGSIAATAEDMARFARMLLNRGAVSGGRLLGEAGFGLLTTPSIATGDASGYAYGLILERLESGTRLRHGGGMPGFVANLICDLDEGIGGVALLNGPGSPTAITTFALQTIRAARGGAPLPPIPPPRDRQQVERAAEYAGDYMLQGAPDEAPSLLSLVAEEDRLVLRHGAGRLVLEQRDDDLFYAPHPDLDGFLLRFERDAAGQVAELYHGPRWYAGRGYSGPTLFEAPADWAAYPGRYRAHNPWVPSVVVALRKGELRLIWTSEYDGADGDEQPLIPLGAGLFRVGEDERGPERVRFDTVVEGRALRLTLSGAPMYRC